jgi:hypothetical protein
MMRLKTNGLKDNLSAPIQKASEPHIYDLPEQALELAR